MIRCNQKKISFQENFMTFESDNSIIRPPLPPFLSLLSFLRRLWLTPNDTHNSCKL